MARPNPRRTVKKFDDADSSDEDRVRNTEVSVDPKSALHMEDLSNATRDRQTAFKVERDHQVNFALINRGRKCNQEGSAEAQSAAVNQSQVSGWNSLGGVDSTTTLEDIARGQSHRHATTKKVQNDTYQLQSEGRDVSAESIDNKFGHAFRSNVNDSTAHDHGRNQPASMPRNSRPLDPAIDPERVYKYKNGGQYGGGQLRETRGQVASRGGRGSGRGGHAMQLGRQPASNEQAILGSRAPALAAPSAVREGMATRAARQRRTQERPWPPFALMGNVEPSANTVAQGTLPVPIVFEAAPVELNASSDVATAPLSENATGDPTPVLVQPQSKPDAVEVLFDHAQPLQPAQNKTKLAANFEEWFRSTRMAEVHPTVETRPASQAQISKPVVEVGLTEPFPENGENSADIDVDQRTDGRLSPVSLSDTFDSATQPVTSPSATRDCSSDLMDIEIPLHEQKALETLQTHSPVAPSEIKADTFETAQTIPVTADKSPVASRFVAGSPLQIRSPNIVPGNDVSRAGPINSALRPQIVAPKITGSPELKSIVGVSGTGSALGDDSKRRRQPPAADNKGSSLQQSRFAAPRPNPTLRDRARHPYTTPGYEQLLRTLAENNLTVNASRRPDEPAFKELPIHSAFTQYREPFHHDDVSDGEL